MTPIVPQHLESPATDGGEGRELSGSSPWSRHIRRPVSSEQTQLLARLLDHLAFGNSGSSLSNATPLHDAVRQNPNGGLTSALGHLSTSQRQVLQDRLGEESLTQLTSLSREPNFEFFQTELLHWAQGQEDSDHLNEAMLVYQLFSLRQEQLASMLAVSRQTVNQALKDLETRNLVVPVVGDFGGPKALRAIARYAREHGAVVSAFYLSNVEQYLRQDGKWNAFCASVASMPLDASSTFIRSQSGGGGFISLLGGMQAETRGCAAPR